MVLAPLIEKINAYTLPKAGWKSKHTSRTYCSLTFHTLEVN
jgi:hypothetical protein